MTAINKNVLGPQSSMKFVIIGGGPTALGAAWRLYDLFRSGSAPPDLQVLVIEKENEVGGLARSITDSSGFTWDLGVHVSGASKFAKYTTVVNEAVGQWNNVPRCVKAFMSHVMDGDNVHQHYVPYPVQSSIPYFKKEIKEKCLADMEELPENKSGDNFAEFAHSMFGDTIMTNFIRPYNEKVWTVSIEEMGTSWAEHRVPKSDIGELRRRCNLSREELENEELSKTKTVFRYPKNFKGVGHMWKRVASTLPPQWFCLNSSVIGIDPKIKKIKLTGGLCTYYDYLINTMPMTELGKLSGLLPNIPLKYSKVVLIGIGMRKPQPAFTNNFSWIYFPLKTTFYRCTFISNFNEHMTPNPREFWSVICEIGIPSEMTPDIEEITEKTIADLLSHGLIESRESIVTKWHHVLPFGYPIPTIERDRILADAHAVFKKHDIYSRGRFGGWKYENANQDHCFTIGSQVVDHILFDSDETML